MVTPLQNKDFYNAPLTNQPSECKCKRISCLCSIFQHTRYFRAILYRDLSCITQNWLYLYEKVQCLIVKALVSLHLARTLATIKSIKLSNMNYGPIRINTLVGLFCSRVIFIFFVNTILQVQGYHILRSLIFLILLYIVRQNQGPGLINHAGSQQQSWQGDTVDQQKPLQILTNK